MQSPTYAQLPDGSGQCRRMRGDCFIFIPDCGRKHRIGKPAVIRDLDNRMHNVIALRWYQNNTPYRDDDLFPTKLSIHMLDNKNLFECISLEYENINDIYIVDFRYDINVINIRLYKFTGITIDLTDPVIPEDCKQYFEKYPILQYILDLPSRDISLLLNDEFFALLGANYTELLEEYKAVTSF